jgi:primosomal protein N' (replication factor Y)
VFADVALPRSAPEPLTYRVPDDLRSAASVGIRVRVPVRGRLAVGIIVGLADTCELDPKVIRPLSEILDGESLLPEHLLDLARFIADYYRCPLGTTLAAMLPAGLLRGDAERVRLTPLGAAVDAGALPAAQGRLIADLQRQPEAALPSLLARCEAGRGAVEALVSRNLATLERSRRDRPAEQEVAAVVLGDGDLEELLSGCGRARAQRAVLEWLADRDGPVLEAEVRGAVGCSSAPIRALEQRGAVHRFKQAAPRRPRWALPGTDVRHRLTSEQHAVVEAVTEALEGDRFAPILLQGVTGSGKTEVYLRCLEACLARDLGGIVLVPEIGLTPAAVGAVERRFGERVAVLHSAQSEGERWREWQGIREGAMPVVVGPRSALFAPLARPGLIVVDEEQDGAYKQNEAPRYHARDVALVLGQRLGVPVLLCTATPSTDATALESRGLASRLDLTQRVGGGRLPEVQLVDLRTEPAEPGEQGRTLFSQPLVTALRETVDADRQAILLMQRRGWAPVLLCRDCGHTHECPSCSVSLVIHRRSRDLRCHYCGYRVPLPESCDSCGSTAVDAVGAGTEKVAHLLERHLPGVPAAILDRDTARRRGGLESALGEFAAGRTRVLVGTQMVAKGHHFPNVTLTGVISADAMLGLPDFRAGERTFQLLTQVAGRAGRGDAPGRVIIQTYHPEHPAVRHAVNHDVMSFMEQELRFRRAFGYPPVQRMVLVRYESTDAAAVRRAAEAGGRALREAEGIRVRGPAPAPLERAQDRWRWQLLLTSPTRPPLRHALSVVEAVSVPKSVHRVVDVDPVSTL